jgi:hypothetical protein
MHASFISNISPSEHQRAQGMPGVQCARSLACEMKKHTSVVTTVTPVSPGIPYAMVLTVSFALSPVIGLSCHRRLRNLFASLTPASRHQDHTTSPSALAHFVKRAISVHRIPLLTSVTIASRPSQGNETAGIGH